MRSDKIKKGLDITWSTEFKTEIQSIVKQIINKYHPQKIILFGSLVKGNYNEGTDIDLFIIKDDVPYLGVERIRQLERMIKYKLATDFIVYKSHEVKERLKQEDPFIRSILKEGKILYAAG